MIRKLLMILALLAPFANTALADHGDNVGYCSQYFDPSQCAADRNCKYDWVVRSCLDAIPGGNGGGNRECGAYNRDPNLCNSQPNCQYDYQFGLCADDWQQPGGSYCSRYDNDAFTCNNAQGCSFDTWQRRCVQDDGGGNGQIRYTQVNCGSGDYRYERCPVYGQVIDATLQSQASFGQCIQGRTWGYDSQGLWVDQGCRGTFQVRYYDR